jgi:hypothetical protein
VYRYGAVVRKRRELMRSIGEDKYGSWFGDEVEWKREKGK